MCKWATASSNSSLEDTCSFSHPVRFPTALRPCGVLCWWVLCCKTGWSSALRECVSAKEHGPSGRVGGLTIWTASAVRQLCCSTGTSWNVSSVSETVFWQCLFYLFKKEFVCVQHCGALCFVLRYTLIQDKLIDSLFPCGNCHGWTHGHFCTSIRAARVSGCICKLLCCCLEY